MATKKATEAVKDEEIMTTDTAEDPATKPADAWSEMVNVIVPRKPHGEEQQYYICVNDRRFAVPANGKMQALPRPIAEILVSSLEAENEAEDYADHIPNRTSENPTPHQIG